MYSRSRSELSITLRKMFVCDYVTFAIHVCCSLTSLVPLLFITLLNIYDIIHVTISLGSDVGF